MKTMRFELWLAAGVLISVTAVANAVNVVPVSPALAAADFSGWELPLPAGEWVITRGPCGSAGRLNHTCDFFEDACAVDLASAWGAMENVPVLAPQSGRVFWRGEHSVSGLTLKLLHPDGRVSGLLHLSKIVVELDEEVTQGQVVGYAGNSGVSGGAHLHFVVQPNAVERSCLDLRGWDDFDFVKQSAVSHNLAWTDLILPYPPAAMPAWLVQTAISAGRRAVVLPRRLILAPGSRLELPVATAGTGVSGLMLEGVIVPPARYWRGYAFFSVPITAPAEAGNYFLELRTRVGRGPAAAAALVCQVQRSSPMVAPGIIWINPIPTSPPGWATLPAAPQLCWSMSTKAGQAPLRFRVMVVGSAVWADSGWIDEQCWQAPPLPAGTYFWKVYVRDARDYVNRSTQRPYAFTITQ